MHILFLTDNFPPEVNAPASRTHEHCRLWAASGHRVTVITCAPNFPKGRVFDGYRNAVWQQEMMDGIHVIRVWSYITANEGFSRRVLDYMSFMLTATLASLFVRRVDVVIGTSPQFFTACAAWLVGALKRVPFIVSFGSFVDETSALADLILPDHAPLESWLDDVPESGAGGMVASLAPPAVHPLHNPQRLFAVYGPIVEHLQMIAR